MVGNISLYADYYYYYQGEKIPLVVSLDSVTVHAKHIDTSIDTSLDSIVRFTTSIDDIEEILAQENMDLLSAEYIVGDSIAQEKMSNCFYIKLHEYTDTTLLHELTTETNTLLVGEVPYMDKWYKIMVANSIINNSLEMSNYFYETGLFADVDPGFIFNFEANCVNDSNYDSQWALPAINACDAWVYTKGNANVSVAVIDQDINLNHPEFSNTHFIYPYDCYFNRSDIEMYGNHGTKVTGVIAANHDGNGMVGIAPNVSIMPIVYYASRDDVSEKLASGISWAVNHGADIINCSWGSPRIETSQLYSRLLECAIQNALFEGRNGKGCIVVFSAGNGEISLLSTSKAIYYPAYRFPELLVVGAIDSNNIRDYSYGKQLDVVAPGKNIYTTNNNEYANAHGQFSASYYDYANGTSFAAPYVSGIAALILSVRPDLTRQEVVDLIETTAQHDVFETMYPFSNKSSRPNGMWCKEVGYGLVDAHAAVASVANLCIQRKTYTILDNPTIERAHSIYAGYAVTDSKPYGNVVLELLSNINFLATNKVVLKPGFHAKAGSKLHIKVDTPTATPSSAPNRLASRVSSTPTENTDSTNEKETNNDLAIAENEVIISTSIYTISGQLIQTIAGGQRNLAHLPNGMYILQHRMSDGSVRSEKIANNK